MKDQMERACGLELPPGLNGVDYKQHFVRAPMSLHPPKENAATGKFNPSQVMKMCMGR